MSCNNSVLLCPARAAGKPIFNVEYTSLSKFNSNACAKVNTFGTVSIRKALSLQFTPRDACALPKLASPSPSPKPRWVLGFKKPDQAIVNPAVHP